MGSRKGGRGRVPPSDVYLGLKSLCTQVIDRGGRKSQRGERHPRKGVTELFEVC